MGYTSRRCSGGGAIICSLLLALGVALLAAPPALAAPAWLAPVDLSKPLRNAFDPQVAMDESGRAVAIWERMDQNNTQLEVQYAAHGLGEGFSPAAGLSHPAQDPKLAMTRGGEALVAWWHSQGGNYHLELSRRPPGGSFSSPAEITAVPQGGSPPEIQIDVNASGKAALAWLKKNEEGKPVVMVSTAVPGGAPTTPTPVSDATHEAAGPQLAVGGDGQVTVAWVGYSATLERTGVVLVSKGSGTSFSAPQDVSEADFAAEPQLALDPSGEPTVAWVGLEEIDEDEDPETPEFGPGVIEAAASSGGTFGAPVEVSEQPADASFFPRLVIGSGGTAVLAWVQRSGSTDLFVRGSVAVAGGEFSSPQPISANASEASRPDVAVNGSGTAMVAWSSSGTSVAEVSIRPPGGPFGAAAKISTPGADALFVKVALSDTGDGVVVWSRSNGANAIVQAAGYDANAPQLNNLSVPATGTVGVPVSFTVEPFDVWPLADTHFDFGDGGSAPGAAASHAYGAPGTYRVTASATDETGSTGTAAADITILASNDFRLGELKRNKRRGTAILTVEVPGPGGVLLFGKGLKRASKRAAGPGDVRLLVKAAGKPAKRLRKRGKTKLKLRVRFSPDGGLSAEKRRAVVLKRSIQGRRRSR
jgi:hypothetical protein